MILDMLLIPEATGAQGGQAGDRALKMVNNLLGRFKR